MSDRLEPTTMSWELTPETALRFEREFHGVDSDCWIIEEYVEDDDTWVPCELSLRLTYYRIPEDG